MRSNIMDMLVVLAAFGLVYTVPTWLVARRINRGGAWAETLLWAWVLGLSSQSIVGLIWSRLVAGAPSAEVFVWLLGWAVCSAWCMRGGREDRLSRQSWSGVALLVILAVSVAVRSLYPLRHWALGQSDAYSHLQFLQDVMAKGHLRNPVYPPGYHWVLAMPAMLFKLDPYLVARYVGAFFGALMVLGAGVFWMGSAGAPAGLVSAALLASFPGFVLLSKTGVGAFANQLGLGLMLPALLSYSRVADSKQRGGGALLLLSVTLAGMASSVPMMLTALVFVGAAERCVCWVRRSEPALVTTRRMLIALVPVIALVLLHFSQADAGSRRRTVVHLVDPGVTKSIVQAVHGPDKPVQIGDHRMLSYATDFLVIKRVGFAHPALTALCVAILAFFAVAAVLGNAQRSSALLLLGVWGGFCTFQVGTGALEFSKYQRAGWSLLLALGCSAGAIFAALDQWTSRKAWFRGLVVLGCTLSIVGGFVIPPVHNNTMSTAEDDLVFTVRAVASGVEPPALPPALRHIEGRAGLVIMTRLYAGFSGGQGDPVDAVLGAVGGVTHTVIHASRDPREFLQEGHPHLILMDGDGREEQQDGIGRLLVPRLSARAAKSRANRYAVNERLREFVLQLEGEGWHIQRFRQGRLDGALATPVN